MRLRIPELLDERGLTPYHLAKKSGLRISLSTAYRLVSKKGRVKMFDAQLAEVLCEVLGVQPGELFELEAQESRRGTKGRKRASTA